MCYTDCVKRILSYILNNIVLRNIIGKLTYLLGEERELSRKINDNNKHKELSKRSRNKIRYYVKKKNQKR